MADPGPLIIIGGHEDKEGERVILKEVARRLRGGRLVIATVASHEPDGYFDAYREAFSALGVDDLVELYVEERARKPLGQLCRRLGDGEWLDGGFTAGDLMMIAVLFRSKPSGILDEYPNLSAYVARGEARPAFKRAFAAQLAVFTDGQSRS